MEDTNPKSSASAPAAVQYVFLFFLLEVLPQFFLVVFILHMLGSILYMHLDLLSAREMILSSIYADVIYLHFVKSYDLFYHCYTSHVLSTISVNKIIR